MTDEGVAISTHWIGFHNWVTFRLSLRCKLRLVLKLSIFNKTSNLRNKNVFELVLLIAPPPPTGSSSEILVWANFWKILHPLCCLSLPGLMMSSLYIVLTADGCLVTFTRVERLDCKVCRPVVLIGPLAEPLINKLTSESPDKYSRCDPGAVRCLPGCPSLPFCRPHEAESRAFWSHVPVVVVV